MSGGQQMMVGGGGNRRGYQLTVGTSPGGQGATYLGFSTNPVVGAFPPGSFKGYNVSLVSEAADGGLQIGLDGAPTGVLVSVAYKGRFLVNPSYFTNSGIGYFFWPAQASRLLVNGETIPFIMA